MRAIEVDEKVQSIQSSVVELTKSLEFSQKEIDDLKQEIKQHNHDKTVNKVTFKKLQDDLQTREKQVDILQESCNNLEDINRRNNLQITGLDECPGETWEQTTTKVTKLMDDKLQLHNVAIERTHRVGQHQGQRSRSVIAQLSRQGSYTGGIGTAGHETFEVDPSDNIAVLGGASCPAADPSGQAADLVRPAVGVLMLHQTVLALMLLVAQCRQIENFLNAEQENNRTDHTQHNVVK
ncbi:hypothetical protein Pcinc_017900 [Petrolisthes cinctipes]|uniref:Uncharacterized protein n=1 Tax=Petrolisthes cinctipes TaxID=88211 RepID=A0AAE1KN24_PETCI|nr:hypothetical protein Pcinc_017900 [Petrolisthes cinctipes]